MSGPHSAAVQVLTPADAPRLVAELKALRAEIARDIGPEDLRHLQRLSWMGRAFSALGYAACVLGPNLASVVLIALGRFTRWVVVAHSVLHKAYDEVGGGQPGWHARTFARGWRRFWDWFDWLEADDWQAQHNISHHCYVGDDRDPDRVAVNMAGLKDKPLFLRGLALLVTAATWKWSYYGPATRRARRGRSARTGSRARPHETSNPGWTPSNLFDRDMLLRAYLPYASVHFVLIPLLLVPLGRGAVLGALINSLLAEVVSNLHSFAIVAPTHTGLDIPTFEGHARGVEEYCVRQIVGSVNYDSAGPVTDFLQGYMGYQIEHHLWPDLPLRQYPRVAKRVEALCREHGLVYRRQSVWRRIAEMVRAVGSETRVPVCKIALPE